ncbi:radical SAM protein [bacterium]|nr:radical SAM protein [bacterium]
MSKKNKIKNMDIAIKLRQKFVVDKISSTDWQQGTNGPLIVELDTTEACDLACPGCVSEEIMDGHRFSNDRLLRLGEELKEIGVQGVVLIGGGEPLAHPAIGDFMQYLGDNDISIGITTNGTFIHRYMGIIAKYSSWTRVSIDAATDSTFLKLRPTKGGKSKFNSILDNMRNLSKIKKGKLGYSFLLRTEIEGPGLVSNIHEIYDAAVLAKEIGCDYFEIKPSYKYKNNAVHSLIKHNPIQMRQARKEIEKLNELVDDNFKVIKAITLDASLDGAEEKQPKDYKTCPSTELRTLLTPSGGYVCPYWRGKDQFNIGNIIDTSLKEIWNSKTRKDIQKYLDPSKHCSFNCLRNDSNLEVFKMIEDIRNNVDIQVIDEFDSFI